MSKHLLFVLSEKPYLNPTSTRNLALPLIA